MSAVDKVRRIWYIVVYDIIRIIMNKKPRGEMIMKIRRIIWIIVICFLLITILRACSDDRHITQKQAENL